MKNIYELINAMEKRPAMYIGDNKISSLNTFLNGYLFSASSHNILAEKVFPPFWFFHEWAMEKYSWSESTAGWKNILLQENNHDEEKSLEVFFKMIKEFKTLSPLSIERLLLSPENIEFHNSEKCNTKSYNHTTKKFDAPLFINVTEVYLLEFSHNFGCSFFVRNAETLISFYWRERFKNTLSAKENLKDLFGENLDWQLLKGDLLSIAQSIVR